MWILAALLQACGPSDTEVAKVYPEAATSLTVLDFGDTPVAYSSTMSFDVINSGPVTLHVSDVAVDDGMGAYELLSAPAEVGAGERESLAITFHPPDYTDYAGTVTFTTDDPDNPELTVALTGHGIPVPTPDIAVDTTSLDFGTVAPGEVGTKWVVVSNEGDGTLEIQGATQGGSGEFEVVGNAGSFSLDPGQSTNVIVLYTPSSDVGANGTLTFVSNDPDEAETVVYFIGNGGSDLEYPVAVIDGPTVTEPRQTVTLDGSASYDPQGLEPLTYEWTLVAKPDGSQAELSEPTTLDSVYLPTDIAGVYLVQLQVRNSIGLLSAPATFILEAVPAEYLHVELSWNTGGADLDLHLLTSAGVFFQEPYDCTWCNQTPAWGASGSTDDPSLDIDDLSGYGPENVNIDIPADDTYYVKVHYYTDNGDDEVVATVRVYAYGALVGEFSKVLERNDVWDVAEIRWPDGVAIEQTTDLYASTTRGCTGG